MSSPALILKLGAGLLRARPTLTSLAVLILGLGSALISGFSGTQYLLKATERTLATSLELELELVDDSELTRTSVLSRVQQWPGILRARYVSAEELLTEIEASTGENLRELFGTNPFPSLIRVRVQPEARKELDNLLSAARTWPEISTASYPQNLWSDLDHLQTLVRKRAAGVAVLAAVITLLLTGLCLRAQVRSRYDEWHLLHQFGMSKGALTAARTVQAAIVGLLGALLAGLLILATANLFEYLFLTSAEFPSLVYVQAGAISLALSIVATLLGSVVVEPHTVRRVSNGEG